jgi:drug/metabolite transporter (DMT)-like permease
MTPIGFATWRALFGAAFLAVVVAAMRQRGRPIIKFRRLPRRAVGALALAAASGIILNLAIFVAFSRITVALALLAFYTYPALVAVVAIVIERRRPHRLELVALALALGGMTLVVLGQLDPSAGLVVDALGLGLALLAAVAQTVYIITSRAYAFIPAEQAATILLWIAVLAYVLIALATGSLDAIEEPFRNPVVWPYVVVAGLLGAGLPSMLFLVAIRLIGPVRTGILAMLEPVTGTVLAALILGETLGPIQLLGGTLVIAAGVLLQRAPTPVDAPPSHPIQVPAPG